MSLCQKVRNLMMITLCPCCIIRQQECGAREFPSGFNVHVQMFAIQGCLSPVTARDIFYFSRIFGKPLAYL